MDETTTRPTLSEGVDAFARALTGKPAPEGVREFVGKIDQKVAEKVEAAKPKVADPAEPGIGPVAVTYVRSLRVDDVAYVRGEWGTVTKAEPFQDAWSTSATRALTLHPLGRDAVRELELPGGHLVIIRPRAKRAP